MRKLALVTTLILGTSVAFAQFNGPSSTEVKEGTQINTTATISVKDAISLKDDANVILEGSIVKHLRGDKYLFKDSTGEVVVEIDDKDWRGVQVSPEDTVIIYGEVDHHRHKPTDIDVDRIMLKP